MRKLIALSACVVSLAVISPTRAHAQLGVGARGGLVSAQFGGDIDYNSRSGFYVGAFASLSLGNLWSIHPEVALVQKGATDENLRASGGGVTIVERNNKLTYVEFLVPLTITPPVESGQIQPRVYAAPAIAFQVSCTTEFDNAPELPGSFDCDERVPVLNDAFAFTPIKSIDYGLVVGVGIDVGGGRTVFTADARYDVGIANINDLSGAQEVKNRALVFLIGLRYSLTP